MASAKQYRSWIVGIGLWTKAAAFVLALLVIASATQVQAQTYTVLHSFTHGMDGATPYAGLTLDGAGNLYGTTPEGAIQSGHCYPGGCGAVFRLKHTSSGWIFTPLYLFTGKADSGSPLRRADLRPRRHSVRHSQRHRHGLLRHGFQPEASTGSLHIRSLFLESNRHSYLLDS